MIYSYSVTGEQLYAYFCEKHFEQEFYSKTAYRGLFIDYLETPLVKLMWMERGEAEQNNGCLACRVDRHFSNLKTHSIFGGF